MPHSATRRNTAREGEIVSTYLSPADASTLRARAAAADRSIAAEIRRALRPYLNDQSPADEPGSGEDTSGVEAADHVLTG